MKGAWKLPSLALVAALITPACMMTSTHEEILKKTKTEDQAAFDQMQQKLEGERDAEQQAKKECLSELAACNSKADQQEAMMASMSMKIDKLSGEKGQLAAERAELSQEQQQLMAQVDKLKQMQAVTERRNAEFRRLLEKLKVMMDAGTLQVKPRNGLLVVRMASDIVFAPGSTRIKEEAREALTELAHTLATFEDRRFQVMGHTDDRPIRSARFPSNWELSTQRAVEVVKLLIDNGVQPEMISAAGSAEFDPLVDNDTRENRTLNRRVEIVFMPKIDELPGFDKVLSE
jgi:chemotaxis protein MotB